MQGRAANTYYAAEAVVQLFEGDDGTSASSTLAPSAAQPDDGAGEDEGDLGDDEDR